MDYININNSIEKDLEFLSDFREDGLSSAMWAIETMKKLRANANVYEKKLAEFLFWNNVNYYTQVPFKIVADKKRHVYFADFYIPEIQTIIEVDGESHEGEGAKQKDAERDEMFLRIGILTVRVKNKSVMDGQMDEIPIPRSAYTEKKVMEKKMKLSLLSKDTDVKEGDDLELRRKKMEADKIRREEERAAHETAIEKKRQLAPIVVSEAIGTDYFMTFFSGTYNEGKCAYYGVNVFNIIRGNKNTVCRLFDTMLVEEKPSIPKTTIPGIPILSAISVGLSKLPTNCSVAIYFTKKKHCLSPTREMLYKLFVGAKINNQWKVFKDDVELILKSNKLKRIVACTGFSEIKTLDDSPWPDSYSNLFWEDYEFDKACREFRAEVHKTKPTLTPTR